jgi:hypothetical protein
MFDGAYVLSYSDLGVRQSIQVTRSDSATRAGCLERDVGTHDGILATFNYPIMCGAKQLRSIIISQKFQ